MKPREYGRAWSRVLSGVLLVACLCGDLSRAAEPGEPPLRFRQLYVPAAEIPKRRGVYLPLRREEFERLLRVIQARQAGPALTAGARLDRADYSARLIGDDLVEGTAKLTFVHTASQPVALPLSPCRLAIRGARWRTTEPAAAEPAAAPAAPPALASALIGVNEAGETLAIVAASGELEFSWSLRGRREASGELAFSTGFPASPINRLLLTLPAGARPFAADAAVSNAAATDTWAIDFTGDSLKNLRITPAGEPTERPQQVLLRQSATYSLKPHGAELLAELRLDVPHRPLGQLLLAVDPGLQIVDVRHGDTALSWSRTEAAGESQQEQIAIEFPEPLSGFDRRLRVRAVAALRLDEEWRLPRLIPQDVTWEEGTSQLDVYEPLELKSLVPTRCSQSAVAPLPAPTAGESIQLQGHGPDAELALRLALHQGEVVVRAGTTVRLGDQEVVAKLVADCTSTGRDVFAIQARLSPSWSIDAVESVPADQLEDWTELPGGGQNRLIRVRLRKPVQRGSLARLIFTAKSRGLPIGGVTATGFLPPLQLPEVKLERGLISVGAAPPFQVRLHNDQGSARLAADSLSQFDAELIDVLPGGFIFADGPAAGRMGFSISSEPPHFAARVAVEAAVDNDRLQVHYAIRLTPEASSLRDVLVHFSEAAAGPPQWSLAGEDAGALTEELLGATEPAAASLRGGETWRIHLARARTDPFELSAVRTMNLAERQSVPLASLPQATEQFGSVTVRRVGLAEVAIEPHLLRAVPLAPTAAGEIADTLAAFRYEPLQTGRLSIARRNGKASLPACWIWLSRMSSRFAADGHAVHSIRWQIENAGAPHVDLAMPAGVRLLQVSVDGQVRRPLTQDLDDSRLRVPLPPLRRFPQVEIEFSDQGRPLGARTEVAAHWPRPAAHVLQRQWEVWLPPGFATASADAPPPSWSERLFGPLARPAFVDRAGLWSAPAAEGLLRDPLQAGPAAANRRAAALLQFLGRWQTLQDAQPAIPLEASLADALADFANPAIQPDAAAAERLRIDRLAFGRAGLAAPQDLLLLKAGREVADANAADEATAGMTLLENAGLALLADPDFLVLTTLDGLREVPGDVCLQPRRGLGILRADSGLAEQIRAGTTLRFPTARAWLAEPADAIATTPEAFAAGESPADRGWTSRQLPVPPFDAGETERVTTLTVIQPAIWHAYGALAWLATAGLVAWLARWWSVAAAGVVVASGWLALFISTTYLPVATGCFLGALSGCWLAWLRWPNRVRQAAERSSALTRVVVPAAPVIGGWLLWAAIGFSNSTGAAQQPAPNAAAGSTSSSAKPAEPPTYSVLNPIDDQQQPSGDYVYLPAEFYDALYRRAAFADAAQQQWLIHAASYALVLDWNIQEQGLAPAVLNAAWQIEVLRPEVVVRLPIARDSVILLPNQAKLNGEPASLQWSADGGQLLVEVPRPGSYRFELALRPKTEAIEERTQFSLGVPAVSDSSLQLEMPAEAIGVAVPTALGAEELDPTSGTRRISLGPATKLTVRWPTAQGLDAQATRVEVDEMFCLKVRPNSVVLDARMRFTAGGGRLGQLRLRADPRLKLLPQEADAPFQVHRLAGDDGQTFIFDAKSPLERTAVIEASFLVAEASGVGQVGLPRLEAEADRVARRRWAVTIAPNLDFEIPAELAARPADAAEFVKDWPDAQPTRVFDLTASDEPPMLATRPREPSVAVEQQLAVQFRREWAVLRFDATMRIDGGSRFQQTIAIPEYVEIESISLKSGESEIVSRWSREERDRVLVLFSGAAGGDCQWLLRGRMKVQSPGRAKLPVIEFVNAALNAETVEIFQQPEVRLNVVNKSIYADSAEAAATLGEHRRGWGRRVAALTLPPPAAASKPTAPGKPGAAKATAANLRRRAVTLGLSRNDPQATATLITTLRRDADAWSADAEIDFRVTGGAADAFRLEVPTDWQNPQFIEAFEADGTIAPTAEIELSDLPGASRRQLLIRPRQPVTDALRVRLSGRLGALGGERIHAPVLVPLDVVRTDAYLVLPRKIQQQQIAWETSGLQATASPAGLPSPPPDAAANWVYQAVAGRYQAVLTDVKLAAGTPRVWLCEVLFDAASDGAIRGLATFDLEPAGLDAVRLQLPAGYRLENVQLDEAPALIERQDATTWTVSLGPQQLPQQLRVAFSARIDLASLAADRRAFVSPPRLLDLPVKQSLWTLHAAGRPTLATADAPGQVAPARAEWLRWISTLELAEQAADVATDADPQDAANWFVPWSRRLASSRRRLAAWQADPAAAGELDSAEIAAADVRLPTLAERFGAQDNPLDSSAASILPQFAAFDPAAGVFDGPFASADAALTCLTFAGEPLEIAVRFAEPPRDERRSRAAVAIALLLAAAGWTTLWHRAAARLGPTRRRWLLVAALGGMWWLWLTPSSAGLVLIAAALVALVASLRPVGRPLAAG